MIKRPILGLALGGGGALGIAHIGVLKVLEREKIPIDLIVGTSIGALLGAAYGANPDAISLEKRVSEVLNPNGKEKAGLKLLGRLQWNDSLKPDFFHRVVRIAQKEIFLNLATFREALLSENDLHECIEAFLPDIDLKETSIPCAVTAVDLVSGRQVVLKHGRLIHAVMASCAVPGFMPPVRWDEMVLVDGAVVGPVPACPAKDEGADIVIGVVWMSNLVSLGLVASRTALTP